MKFVNLVNRQMNPSYGWVWADVGEVDLVQIPLTRLTIDLFRDRGDESEWFATYHMQVRGGGDEPADTVSFKAPLKFSNTRLKELAIKKLKRPGLGGLPVISTSIPTTVNRTPEEGYVRNPKKPYFVEWKGSGWHGGGEYTSEKKAISSAKKLARSNNVVVDVYLDAGAKGSFMLAAVYPDGHVSRV